MFYLLSTQIYNIILPAGLSVNNGIWFVANIMSLSYWVLWAWSWSWLKYIFGGGVSYLSDLNYEWFAAGDTSEGRLGLIFGTWCIVTLHWYATLYNACLILRVANDIRHAGRKMIFWSWGVGEVTIKSVLSDPTIKKLHIFEPRKSFHLKLTQSRKIPLFKSRNQI